jgi:hypothetical protein
MADCRQSESGFGAAAVAQDGNPHRRARRRARVLKGASILNGVDASEIKCTIRNMHEDGAELQLPAEVVVPNEFLLYVPLDGIAYKAVVRWRAGNRIGVMFVGTEPKPRWHYG